MGACNRYAAPLLLLTLLSFPAFPRFSLSFSQQQPPVSEGESCDQEALLCLSQL